MVKAARCVSRLLPGTEASQRAAEGYCSSIWERAERETAVSIVEQSIMSLGVRSGDMTPVVGVRWTERTCEPSGTMERIISCCYFLRA